MLSGTKLLDELDYWTVRIIKKHCNGLSVIKQITHKSKLKDIGIHALSDQCFIMAEIRNLTQDREKDDRTHETMRYLNEYIIKSDEDGTMKHWLT